MFDGRKIVFFRVYSGKVEMGDKVLNVRTGKEERMARLFLMHSNKRKRIKVAEAGAIIAASGLKLTSTGDTLCSPDHPILLESIEARTPVINAAIEPEKRQDKDKLMEVLAKIVQEDPTFRFNDDEATGEIIISGMGELHIEIVADRINREYKLPVRVGSPNVVYKETLLSGGVGTGLFERETDDESIYGQVDVQITPLEPGGGEEVKISASDSRIKGELVDALKNGALDGLVSGPVQGEQVVDVQVDITKLNFAEGKTVTPLGFRIATGIAVREALKQGRATILEPIMESEITIPEESLGDIIGDLSQRGGRIEDVEDQGPLKVVKAMVALRKMFGYSTGLRSMTRGRGVFSMKFANYGSLDS
jgi:elongation factor G